jgi:branched-chain amino acid transport system substrate-binding protein
VLPLTEDSAVCGEAVRRGLELAVEERNAAGGIDGKVIELLVRDSGSDPAKAGAAMDGLLGEDKVMAVIGGVTIAEATALAPVATREERALVSPTASTPGYLEGSRYAFSVYPSNVLEASVVASFLKHELRVKYAAVVYTTGQYGQEVKNEFVQSFRNQKGEVLRILSFAPGTAEARAPEFAGALAELKPEAVYVVGYWKDTAAVARALRAAGYEGGIYATSCVDTPGFPAAAGDAAEGLVFARPPFDDEAGKGAEFSQAFRQRYGVEPPLFSAYGYDAAQVVIAGLEKSGGYAKDVMAAVRRTEGVEGATGPITFDTDGGVIKDHDISAFHEGVPIDWDEYTQMTSAGGGR